METKVASILGLIGGILVVAGIFTPWYTAAGTETSGWDLTKAPPTGTEMVAPYLLLGAGVLIILTCLIMLLKPLDIVEALMGTFTVLAGASAVGVFMLENALTDMGYGAYVLLVGAILALIAKLVKKGEK